MQISLNLSTRLNYNRNLVRQLLRISLGLLSFMIICLVVRIISLRIEKSRISSEINQFDRQLAGQSADVSQKDLKLRKDLILAMNAMLEKHADNSWISMLDSIETLLPSGVSVSRLAPEKKDGLLKLEGRARGLAAIQQLLENLEKSGQFREPLLVSHSEMLIGDRIQGIQFLLTVKMVRK